MEPQTAYAKWLRARLNERKLTVYAFSRLVNPDDPETARSSIRRHLRNVVPGVRVRQRYARVLGTGDDLGPPGGENGDLDLIAALLGRVEDILAEVRVSNEHKKKRVA